MSENADLEAIERGGGASPRDPVGLLASLVAAIGTTWTFFLMLLIVADVIGRSFLSRPITGVAEIAAHSVVAIVFLQLAAGIHARRMTRADFLIEKLNVSSPRLGAALETAFLAAGTVIMLMIAYAGWKPLMASYAASEYFGVRGVFTVPTWPFRAIIIFGSLLAAVVLFLQTLEELRKLGRGGV